MLKRPPALGQQREAALAQAAHRPQQRIAGPGINVQLLDPGRLLHRDVDAVTSAFVARISQHRHRIQERPQHAQDILPCRGQVMHIARQHIRNPQRDPGGVKQGLDIPAEVMGLPRIPQIDDLALAAGGFLPAPVRVHDLAVQDQVRHPRGQGVLQLLLQPRRAGREHVDGLVQVAVSGGLRQPEAAAEPRDVPFVPEPGQGEQRLPVAAQPAGSLPRADLAAVTGQQAGNEPDQVPGHVEHDTIGDHAEPLPGSGCSLARLLLPGAPRLPGDLRVCPHVCLDVQLRHVCRTRPCWENLIAS